MEEPQRSKVLAAFAQIGPQWEETLARTRENIAAGAQIEDIIAAEGASFLATEGWGANELSFALASVMVIEASRTPRSRGAKKAAVPAKRRTKAQMLKEAAETNAATLEAGDAESAA